MSTQHLAHAPTTDLAPLCLDPASNVEVGVEKLVEMSEAFVAELCAILRSHGNLPLEALLTLCPLPTHLTSQGIDMAQLLVLYPHFIKQDASQIISVTELETLEVQSGPNASSSCQLDTPASIAAQKQTLQYSDYEDQEETKVEFEDQEGEGEEEEEEDNDWSSRILRPNRVSAQTENPHITYFNATHRYHEEREEDEFEEEDDPMDEQLQEGYDLIQQFVMQQQELDLQALSSFPYHSRPSLKHPRPPMSSRKPQKHQSGNRPQQALAKSGQAKNPRPVNARALALDREVIMLHEIDRPVAERMIRDKLGNNPDTSKSLRRLAMEGKVVRHGAGGRGEPFRYELTELGREIYRELMSSRGR